MISTRFVASALTLAFGLFVTGCSAETAGDPDDLAGEGLEGLTADDAEARAEKLLAQANANRTNFENEESLTRAQSGVAPAGLPFTEGSVGIRTLADDTRDGLGRGTWGFRFEVLDEAGRKTVLSEDKTAQKLMGASTFKLFTGWTAFKTGSTRASTLTLMLRASKNNLANLAMCQNGEKIRGYDAACTAQTTPTSALRMRDAIPATRSYLGEQGVGLSSTFTMKDGSGLDSGNVLTIDDLTSLLEDVNADPKRDTFLDMLAQPGVSSTLVSRFSGLEGKLFAKTGTYYEDGGGVKSLAGIVKLAAGKALVFAVVGNGTGDPKAALDRIEKAVRLNIDAAR
jgi:hypothetical protein